MRRASDAPTIAELPVALLGHVMALACGDEGAAAAPCLRLVSRCWHAVFWSEPGLWRHLHLKVHQPERSPEDRDQRRAGKQRLLQRVGRLAAAVDVLGYADDKWGPPPDEDATEAAVACLQQLQPGTLMKVTLCWQAALPAAILQALPSFSQALVLLKVYCLELPPAAAPLLAQLTQLQSFEHYYWDEDRLGLIREPPLLSPAAVTAITQAANLTSLVLGLGLRGDATASLAGALPRLPHLRKLRVAVHGPPGLPQLQHLTVRIVQHNQLTALDLSAPRRRLCLLECLTQLTGLQHLGLHEGWTADEEQAVGVPTRFPLPTAFPALRSYSFSSYTNCRANNASLVFSLPAAGITLRHCRFVDEGKLLVFGLQQDMPFAEVLRLLVPPGCQVEDIFIDGWTAPEGVLSECCQMPALRELSLTCIEGMLALADAAMPLLRSLSIAGRWGIAGKRLGLQLERVALPALEALSFGSSEASFSLQHMDLPALSSLEVSGCSSANITDAVVPALASMTIDSSGSILLARNSMPALTELVMKGSHTAFAQAPPALQLADMALPALQTLEVNNCSASLLRVSLPELHTLRVNMHASWNAADVALPALRIAHMNATPEGNLPILPSGLEELHILGLPRLPPALTALVQLRRLTIIDTPQSSFKLMREDVDAILCRLPHLTDLRMNWTRCTTPPVMLHLFRSMSQLQEPQIWGSRH